MSTDWRRIRPSTWHPWSLAGLFAPVALAFVGFAVRGVVSIIAGGVLFGLLWLLVPVAIAVFWMLIVQRGARVHQQGVRLLDRLGSIGSPNAWAVLDTVELRDALADVPPDEPTRPGALRELPPPIIAMVVSGRAFTLWELRGGEAVSIGSVPSDLIAGIDARAIRTGARTRRGLVVSLRPGAAPIRTAPTLAAPTPAATRTMTIVPVQLRGRWFVALDDDAFSDILATLQRLITEP